MSVVLVIEPDRVQSQVIITELRKNGLDGIVVRSASEAIQKADEIDPVAVITELSLPSHSGSEFLYEFRTYKDWSDVPIYIFTTLTIPEVIQNSADWQALNPMEYFYKPEHSLSAVIEQLKQTV